MQMLEALHRIRTHLTFGCTDFVVADSMLANCNSEIMCSISNKDEEDDNLIIMDVV